MFDITILIISINYIYKFTYVSTISLISSCGGLPMESNQQISYNLGQIAINIQCPLQIRILLVYSILYIRYCILKHNQMLTRNYMGLNSNLSSHHIPWFHLYTVSSHFQSPVSVESNLDLKIHTWFVIENHTVYKYPCSQSKAII